MNGPNSSNLNPLDYQVWGNAGVLTKASTEAKTSSRVLKCTLVNLVCVTLQRKTLKTLWKTTTSDCRHVCQPTVDILNI